MAKALPDKHIDPSPRGVDNIISNLPLPGIDLKRDLPLGLGGLLGSGSGSPSRGAKSFPKGSANDGSMFTSFVPLDKNGDAVRRKPHSSLPGSSTPIDGDSPILRAKPNGGPLTPLKGVLGVRGLDGKPKRDHRELARRIHVGLIFPSVPSVILTTAKGATPSTYSGAVELDDHTDAPYWH